MMCTIKLYVVLFQLLATSYLTSAVWYLQDLQQIQQLALCTTKDPIRRLVTFKQLMLEFTSFCSPSLPSCSNPELNGIVIPERTLKLGHRYNFHHYSYFASRFPYVEPGSMEGLLIPLHKQFTAVYFLQKKKSDKAEKLDNAESSGVLKHEFLYFRWTERLYKIPVYTGSKLSILNTVSELMIVKCEDLSLQGIICKADTNITSLDKKYWFSFVCDNLHGDANSESSVLLPQRHIIFSPMSESPEV